MGIKTAIDWCDSTYNPVTGCLHNCEYCYARRIVERFGGYNPEESPDSTKYVRRFDKLTSIPVAELGELQRRNGKDGRIVPACYPFGFWPTLHRYRLDDLQRWKKVSRTIFVCSMADLFGEWVPDEWIEAVLRACKLAPWNTYLFLTKNPSRYLQLAEKGLLPRDDNLWFGYSATKEADLWKFHHADECPVKHLFVSVEPILGPIKEGFSSHCPADWVIVGAETGNRKGKVIPRKEWIDFILMDCEYAGRPIFMKESLRELMGEDFRQEFPWEVKRNV